MTERTLPELLYALEEEIRDSERGLTNDSQAILAEIIARFSPPAPAIPDGILQLRRKLYKLDCQVRGRFWLCLRCKNIVHSYNQLHPCGNCGNKGSSGWWTSTQFEEWEKLNPMPDDFEVDQTEVAALNEQEKR